MELELKRGGRTARVETLGGELVSYRDERGLEYIWYRYGICALDNN